MQTAMYVLLTHLDKIYTSLRRNHIAPFDESQLIVGVEVKHLTGGL